MTKVTNVSEGPRGIFRAGGVDADGKPKAGPLVMLEAGKSADIDLMPGEESGEWFRFGDSDGDDDDGLPALAGMNKSVLLAQAEAEGVDIEDGATKADIIAAIELAREAGSEA